MRADLLWALPFWLAYLAGSELGYALSLGPSVGGTFWPPAGISLAVLLAAPARTWPMLVAAGALANFASDSLHGQTLAASVGFAVANLGEAVIGAALLRRIFPAPITFTRLPELLTLALVVVFVSAPIGAAIGAVTANWHTENPPGLLAGWTTWWVGDAVGALVLTPFVLGAIDGWRALSGIRPRRWLEAAAFGLAVWTVTDIVFSAPPTSLGMPFLVFPVLLWGSLRLGMVAIGAALCLIVALTTHDTAAGLGPFAAEHLSLGERLVALQTYVGVMALSFHLLAVVWEERARTAAALRLAHSGLTARHRRILEQSPLAILTVQAGGRVLDTNPAWRRLWAPAPSPGDTAAGRAALHDPRLDPLLARAFAGEVVELPEREVLVHGGLHGGVRRVRGFVYPVKDDSGGVAEVVLIEQDITGEVIARQQLIDANRALLDREEALSHALRDMADAQAHREQLLEAERFARADAERASTLKDEFLATLSHELRTPLNAIVGWADILRRTSSDPALAPAIDTIMRNAQAQARLIDDLLDMSRIMAGKVGLTIARDDLVQIVRAAADALQPIARRKGVALAVEGPEGAVSVSCDPARLQQVVTNLLDNGIKFTPPGGRVEASVTASGGEARLVVRDTGQGIPADFLGAVFDRFRQADGSITRRQGGLGLGLSIARQIVEMHGGVIQAHSDGPGQGSAFTVTLPLTADAARLPPAPVDVLAVPLAGLRVLVVDDDEDARELLRRLLIEQGCAVRCEASAQGALRAFDEAPWDVLLTDIGMPETDGYELVGRVRAGARPYAIAVTAFARLEDRERALAAGFDAHLPKPVNAGQLVQLLARAAAASAPNGGGALSGSDA